MKIPYKIVYTYRHMCFNAVDNRNVTQQNFLQLITNAFVLESIPTAFYSIYGSTELREKCVDWNRNKFMQN